MKPKPLKNKAFELDPNASADEGAAFWFLDVKSAVQGLLKEVKLRKISIDKLPNKKEIVFDTKEKFVSDFNQEIESIVEEIKKWFPDVVSEK